MNWYELTFPVKKRKKDAPKKLYFIFFSAKFLIITVSYVIFFLLFVTVYKSRDSKLLASVVYIAEPVKN